MAPAMQSTPRMMRSTARVLRVVIGTAAIAAIALWLQARGEMPRRGRKPASPAPIAVHVATAVSRDVPIWLDGLGTVTASQQVTVHPQVDGRLDEVRFTEGQPVRRGDVLAVVDPRPFRLALAQAEGALARDAAQLDTNRRNVTRYRGLAAQRLVAPQTVEQYEGAAGQLAGAVAIDRAQVDTAKLSLDYTQVRAPIDGVAGMRQVDAGNLVHQTDAAGLVVLTAIDPIAVVFTVPQDELGAIAAAQARGAVPVEVYSRDGATRLATGRLAVIDNLVDAATSTLRLKALVPNPAHALWPDAFVKVRLLVDTRAGATVVPAVAVQTGPQGSYVYAVGTDHTAQLRPVTVALTTGDTAVIARGVAPDDAIVVEGQDQLRPGGAVTVAASPPASPPPSVP